MAAGSAGHESFGGERDSREHECAWLLGDMGKDEACALSSIGSLSLQCDVGRSYITNPLEAKTSRPSIWQGLFVLFSTVCYSQILKMPNDGSRLSRSNRPSPL